MSKIHKHAILVSVICFSKGAILTQKRQEDPWKDFYQLPEDYIRKGEGDEAAAIRILHEASGLTGTKMKLIGVHTALDRIPNTRVFMLSYLAMQWTGDVPLEGVRWISDWRSEQLAFEHNLMLLEADSVLETALMSRSLYAVR
jgi:ADP-ribose pyrophosphatase YjhB (NUDIX family)